MVKPLEKPKLADLILFPDIIWPYIFLRQKQFFNNFNLHKINSHNLNFCVEEVINFSGDTNYSYAFCQNYIDFLERQLTF